MRPAPDYQLLPSPDGSGAWSLACWEAYDRRSRVDLHACALTLADGRLFFVDPIPLAEEALDALLAVPGTVPAAVFVTNGNHARAAAAFSARWRLPLWAGETAALSAGLAADASIASAGGWLGDGVFEAIPLPGGATGELALYHPHGGGLMIVGDALINLPSHPFSVLPDKYCDNPTALRHSLAALLDRPFRTLAFAHGQPLTNDPQGRLAALLGIAPPPVTRP